jgi:hypothetical protein
MLTAVLGWIIFHESLPGTCKDRTFAPVYDY